jgi:hypothetical protein
MNLRISERQFRSHCSHVSISVSESAEHLIADTNVIYLTENIGCAVLNSRLCPHISRVPRSYF